MEQCMNLPVYPSIVILFIQLCMLRSCRAFIFCKLRLQQSSSKMSTVTATSTSQPFVSDAVQQQRDQFAAYVLARNWKFCESYWSRTIKHSCYALPPFIEGDVVSTYSPTSYGVSNLSVIREAGMKGEFISKNDRYQKRQTFALRIGYDGNQYHGYQKQTYCPGLTVEGDLTVALERNTIGAGRTDRGVSGISQVICFATQDMTVKAEDLISKFKESAPFKEGRLAVYDCQRVPKKFHSRASATWRRYLYLFPLNRIDGANECDGDGGGKLRGVYADAGMDPASAEGADGCAYDVDIDHLNRILSRLEGQDLPYNAFAFKEDRNAGQGLQDRCTLFRARARVVNLAECAPGEPWGPTPVPIALDPALVRTKRKWGEHDLEQQVEAEAPAADAMVLDPAVDSKPIAVESIPTGGKAQRKQVSGAAAEVAEKDAEPADPAESADADDEEGAGDGAEGRMHPFAVDTTTVELPARAQVPALCIELVGSRFLRRMVRILTATAIREATAGTAANQAERNENVLVDICNSGDRERAARALPGPPLCLAGVGYDAHDLAIYKFMPKVENNARLAEQKLEKAAWAQSLSTGSS